MSATLDLPRRRPDLSPDERAALRRRAKLLAWSGNAWHLIEFAVAVGAGVAAGSVALVGFGLDSLIEVAAGGVVIWLFSGGRGVAEHRERRAQQLIAASYALLVAYIAVEATRDLVGAHHSRASWVGIGLAAFTAPAMPLLAHAKRVVGRKLDSRAAVGEAGQNLICAQLSLALLIGLLTSALLGWWWADATAALVIAVVAAREGVATWRGTNDCCSPAAARSRDSGGGGCFESPPAGARPLPRRSPDREAR